MNCTTFADVKCETSPNMIFIHPVKCDSQNEKNKQALVEYSLAVRITDENADAEEAEPQQCMDEGWYLV